MFHLMFVVFHMSQFSFCGYGGKGQKMVIYIVIILINY